jgi:hypothetical protein
VNRPNRQHPRKVGKHDTADTEADASAIQANTATDEPTAADGMVEMVRALRTAVAPRVESKHSCGSIISIEPACGLRTTRRNRWRLVHGRTQGNPSTVTYDGCR